MIKSLIQNAAGFMKIGGSLYGSGGRLSIGNRTDYGLKMETISFKASSAQPNDEEREKKKITQNFEAALTERLKNDRGLNKTDEEVQALVNSIAGVVERIRNDFGEGMATEAMAKIITGTEIKMNDVTIANALGSVLKAKQAMLEKTVRNGGLTEAEVEYFEKEHHVIKKDPKTYDPGDWKKDLEKVNQLVEFLNEESDSEGDGNRKTASLSSALNEYYGEVVIKDEERMVFSDKFDWLSKEAASGKNREYFNSDYGFDFAITVEEFGRGNLAELIDFLRNDLEDEEGAQLIENLLDADDVFAAINYLMTEHYEDPQESFAKNIKNLKLPDLDAEYQKALENGEKSGQTGARSIADKLKAMGSAMKIVEDAKKALESPEGETEPESVLSDELPEFDYNSKYGPFQNKSDDYNINLSLFVTNRLLDRANEAIRENSAVRERFLEIAKNNFAGNKDLVPENYGLTAFPTLENLVGSVSTTNIMSVMSSTAAERNLNFLKNMLPGSPYGLWLGDGPHPEADPDNPCQRRYDDALQRYQREKGLLLNESA
ncbi:MAG: hypothetical protein LBR53_00475 [Deltaproteobacteria bacterium]|jgi:hypothetical protein|nr:hypothetical protein [Deltaproteobacteria bacterium]